MNNQIVCSSYRASCNICQSNVTINEKERISDVANASFICVYVLSIQWIKLRNISRTFPFIVFQFLFPSVAIVAAIFCCKILQKQEEKENDLITCQFHRLVVLCHHNHNNIHILCRSVDHSLRCRRSFLPVERLRVSFANDDDLMRHLSSSRFGSTSE